jgi:anti-sigma regulatory factor (Ser/Thr protein kinase)
MELVSEITLPAELSALSSLYEFIERSAERMSLSPSKTYDLQLVSSELVTNVIEHGYQGASGEIKVRIAQDDASVEIIYLDDAGAFDPTAVATPNLTLPLEERPIGGLGIHIVRQVMEEFEYRRLPDQKNKVRLLMHKAQA